MSVAVIFILQMMIYGTAIFNITTVAIVTITATITTNTTMAMTIINSIVFKFKPNKAQKLLFVHCHGAGWWFQLMDVVERPHSSVWQPDSAGVWPWLAVHLAVQNNTLRTLCDVDWKTSLWWRQSCLVRKLF
jgi:hypothetical protein